MRNKRIFKSVQILVLSALFFSVHHSFAALSDCANSVEVSLDANVKMRFCEIPAANGVNIGSTGGQSNETPIVPRNFRAFQMGQFEVTQLQYKTLTGSQPWIRPDGTSNENVQIADSHPAVYISQLDASSFARIMNLVDPTATYRLPTEAEWEYAARGRTSTAYYWGDDYDSNFSFVNLMSTDHNYAHSVRTCPNATLNSRFAGYCANNYGLMHILGNVSEWCQDAYGTYNITQADGHMPVTTSSGASSTNRLARGGSFFGSIGSATVSRRNYAVYNYKNSYVGFRLVRIPH